MKYAMTFAALVAALFGTTHAFAACGCDQAEEEVAALEEQAEELAPEALAALKKAKKAEEAALDESDEVAEADLPILE